MTGYLQRLALKTRQPGKSIQPILGSLFSRPNLRIEAQPVSLETGETVVQPAQTEFAAHADSPPPLGDPIVYAIRAPEEGPKAMEPTASVEVPISTSKRTSLIPIQKKKAESPEITSTESSASIKMPTPTLGRLASALAPGPQKKMKTPVVSVNQSNPADQHRQAAQNPPGESTRALPDQKISEHQELAPSVAVTQRSLEEIVPALANPITAANKKEGMSSRNARPAQRESDEIEFHIGRIEVIAVPPAPAAATNPKRKHGAPSLDEYLRRSTRRAV
jgi:hypothetical protein